VKRFRSYIPFSFFSTDTKTIRYNPEIGAERNITVFSGPIFRLAPPPWPPPLSPKLNARVSVEVRDHFSRYETRPPKKRQECGHAFTYSGPTFSLRPHKSSTCNSAPFLTRAPLPPSTPFTALRPPRSGSSRRRGRNGGEACWLAGWRLPL
jgi:hypothetical protein